MRLVYKDPPPSVPHIIQFLVTDTNTLTAKMKFVIALVLCVAGLNAEAPIRRVPQRFFGFERVQQAPYAPAGNHNSYSYHVLIIYMVLFA